MREVHDGDSIEVVADKVGANVRTGVRKATAALRNGADEVDDALSPTFTQSLADAIRDLRDDPQDAATITGNLLRTHPVAGSIAIAATALVAHRLWSALTR